MGLQKRCKAERAFGALAISFEFEKISLVGKK
jgi:hypothetical protein